jgi:DMSO/TMAO reductase YedYZ molybdopterin-dependent catalytic subunit
MLHHGDTEIAQRFAEASLCIAVPPLLLAYGMNGRDLTVAHGAPVRLRVETQVGYKSMKYLQRIVVAHEFDDGGAKGNIQNGWAWYVGI